MYSIEDSPLRDGGYDEQQVEAYIDQLLDDFH